MGCEAWSSLRRTRWIDCHGTTSPNARWLGAPPGCLSFFPAHVVVLESALAPRATRCWFFVMADESSSKLLGHKIRNCEVRSGAELKKTAHPTLKRGCPTYFTKNLPSSRASLGTKAEEQGCASSICPSHVLPEDPSAKMMLDLGWDDLSHAQASSDAFPKTQIKIMRQKIERMVLGDFGRPALI